MSDGLMAQLATSFLGAGTDALKEETDTVLGNVDQATREADNLVAKKNHFLIYFKGIIV